MTALYTIPAIYAAGLLIGAARAAGLNRKHRTGFPTSTIWLFGVVWPWWLFLSLVKLFAK